MNILTNFGSNVNLALFNVLVFMFFVWLVGILALLCIEISEANHPHTRHHIEPTEIKHIIAWPLILVMELTGL